MFYFTLPLGPRSSVKLTEGLDGRQKKASNGILISSDHLERHPDLLRGPRFLRVISLMRECVRARMELWNRVVREDFRCHRQMFRATAVAETTSFWSQSQPQPWLGTFDLWQGTLLDFRLGSD
jgi:hypothetical protein